MTNPNLIRNFNVCLTVYVFLFLSSCSSQQNIMPTYQAYSDINSSLQESINSITANTLSSYSILQEKEDANPGRAKKWNDKATASKELSAKLIDDLQAIKENLAGSAGGWINNTRTRVKDNINMSGANLWFAQKENGRKLQKNIDQYVKSMNALVDVDTNNFREVNIPLTIGINTNGNIADVEKWNENYFRNMPVMAAVSEITKLQLDIRVAENQFASYCMNHIARKAIKIDQLIPVVSAESEIVEQGKKYRATICLGAIDKSQNWAISIHGKTINTQNGMGIYETTATGLGKKTETAEIIIKNNEGISTRYPCPITYKVVPKSRE